MRTKHVLTCGNEPLSAALISERLDAVVVKFRQQIESMVDSMCAAGVSPPEFRKLTSGLRAESATAALEILVAVLEAADPITPTITQGESVLRFRCRSKKQWLTAFGLATVSRRYFAGDDGAGGVAPLDAMVGMTDRYMTKEAAVGRVSTYDKPRAEDGKAPLLDSRHSARMPESGMPTLIDQVATSVSDVRARRPLGHAAVVCDGKDSIWKTAEERVEFEGSVFIPDFHHASETLSDVADAIFGKGDRRRCASVGPA